MNIKIAYFFLVCIVALSACQSSKINYDTSFWGELEDNQNYLFRAESLTSIADGEINSGSRILFGESNGDFQQVYLTKKTKSNKSKKIKYYLYKPKYKILGSYSTLYSENIIRASNDYSRVYQSGERGGCYYINSNGNRIYVDKSFCRYTSSSLASTRSYKPLTSTRSSGGDVYVKGHYRTSKSGKTTYVKPHTRKRN